MASNGMIRQWFALGVLFVTISKVHGTPVTKFCPATETLLTYEVHEPMPYNDAVTACAKRNGSILASELAWRHQCLGTMISNIEKEYEQSGVTVWLNCKTDTITYTNCEAPMASDGQRYSRDSNHSFICARTAGVFCQETKSFIFFHDNRLGVYFRGVAVCKKKVGSSLPSPAAYNAGCVTRLLDTLGQDPLYANKRVWLATSQTDLDQDFAKTSNGQRLPVNDEINIACETKFRLFCETSKTGISISGTAYQGTDDQNIQRRRSMCPNNEVLTSDSVLQFGSCLDALFARSTHWMNGLANPVFCTTKDTFDCDPVNKLYSIRTTGQNFEQAQQTCREQKMILPRPHLWKCYREYVRDAFSPRRDNVAWVNVITGVKALSTNGQQYDRRYEKLTITFCTTGYHVCSGGYIHYIPKEINEATDLASASMKCTKFGMHLPPHRQNCDLGCLLPLQFRLHLGYQSQQDSFFGMWLNEVKSCAYNAQGQSVSDLCADRLQPHAFNETNSASLISTDRQNAVGNVFVCFTEHE
ncbi:uncharacterized protein LOC135828620 [Sycon ciliatum]|uniref:uncharacterized protein LOC135828620 n=1 Tax=Sycon ciliatum TaxID=27933 RepID=UPI0020AD4D57|eukprot:scpid55851/ scgid8884/ 